MINLEQFLQRYYDGASQSQITNATKLVEYLNRAYSRLELNEIITDHRLLCDIFKSRSKQVVSRTTYQKVKSVLVDLADFCGETDRFIPTREEIIASSSIKYYTSLDELLESIDMRSYEIFRMYNPSTDWLVLKTACALAWLGYTTEEMTKIKKSDLFLVDMHTLKIDHNGTDVFIAGKAFETIYTLLKSDVYRSFNNKICSFSNSEYLIRPASDSAATEPTVDLINDTIRRYNSYIPTEHENERIFVKLIRKYAIFVDVYEKYGNELKTDSDIAKMLAKYFECTPKAAYDHVTEYRLFVKQCYKENKNESNTRTDEN